MSTFLPLLKSVMYTYVWEKNAVTISLMRKDCCCNACWVSLTHTRGFTSIRLNFFNERPGSFNRRCNRPVNALIRQRKSQRSLQPLNAAPGQSSRSSRFVVNDSCLLAKVMALLKQSCCVAGRFSANHLWPSPRSVPHVGILLSRVLRLTDAFCGRQQPSAVRLRA